jgi:predicted transcriptional regulator
VYIRGELVYERVRARVMRAWHHQFCVKRRREAQELTMQRSAGGAYQKG